MKAAVTTTIETLIDLDTMTPSHSVEIEGEDGLPEQVVVAAVVGALKSALARLDPRPEPSDAPA